MFFVVNIIDIWQSLQEWSSQSKCLLVYISPLILLLLFSRKK